jgi:hypothetical protein
VKTKCNWSSVVQSVFSLRQYYLTDFQFLCHLPACKCGDQTFHLIPIMDSTEKDIFGLFFGVGWVFVSGNDLLPGSGGLELGSVWVVSVVAGWRQGVGQRATCGCGTRGNNVRGRPAKRRSRSSVACSSGCCNNSDGGSAVSSSRSANARLFLILSLKNVGRSDPVGVGNRPNLCR